MADCSPEHTTLGVTGRLSDPRNWPRIFRAIAAAKPGIVVSVNMTPTILTVWSRLLRRHSARIVCILHTTVLPKPGLLEVLFRRSVPLADCLVYVSERQRQYWEPRGLHCRRVEVIHNGIDTAHFTAGAGERTTARHTLGFAEDDYVVGLLATFRPEKNHCQLVDAIAALRARGVAAKALFVGDGQTRSATEAHARAKGIAEHAVFVGEQHDVRPLIAAMDVGVLCSEAVETLSLSALEIMAMGAPMVMSDIGGAREIVEDGVNGRLFPVGDTTALVERLSALTERPLRQTLAAAAVATVRRDFTEERMVDRYEKLFQSLADP